MRRPVAIGLVLGAFLVACTAETPVIVPSSPAPTATGTADGRPRPKPKIPVARAAVYSTGDEIIFYDAGRDTVRAVARGEGLAAPAFVSRSLITFLQRSSATTRATLLSLDLKSGTQQTLFEEPDGIDVYDVSPNGQQVAYVTRDENGYPRLRIKTLVGTRATKAVTTMAQVIGREATAADQLEIAYDRDGENLLVVYTWADGAGDEPAERSQMQLRAASGSLVFAPDHADEPTMGVWAAKYKRFYYRTNDGARGYRLRDGRLESVAGVDEPWYHPAVSLDGDHLAYDTGADRPASRIRVLDLNRGSVATIGARGRGYPVFATPKVVWAQEIQPCDDCLSPGVPGARVVRINVNSGKERALAITSLVNVDVWFD